MFSRKWREQKGFTLVELIVVIAIIGVLSAIVVPRFGRFKESAIAQADQATKDVIRNVVMVALVNGDIELENASNEGTINIETTDDSVEYKETNVKAANASDSVESVLNDLLGEDIKAQATGKTGFIITIEENNNVKVEYIDEGTN